MEATPAAPVVVRPPLPALLPDQRASAVRARLGEIAYVGTMVTMPADLWRAAGRASAAGWANVEALKVAGQWATPGQ